MKRRGWIKSNDEDDNETMNIWRKSDDQVKSNIKWNHINNKCNDGKDNDAEPLGEGHSSHSQRKKCDEVNTNKKWSRKAHIWTFTNKHNW